jgi:hypothetical protein
MKLNETNTKEIIFLKLLFFVHLGFRIKVL